MFASFTTNGALQRMNVYAVTVTYSNRSGFVKRLAERLKTIGQVSRFIIIDNGSPPENHDTLKELCNTDPFTMELIRLQENVGSAGGFKKGIMAAEAQRGCEFIWLLDDDNLPEVDALEQLLRTYQTLQENCCLVSLRKSRLLYRKIFNEADVRRKFTPYNAFINYSVLHTIRKKLLYSRKKYDLIPIPYAPTQIPDSIIFLLSA